MSPRAELTRSDVGCEVEEFDTTMADTSIWLLISCTNVFSLCDDQFIREMIRPDMTTYLRSLTFHILTHGVSAIYHQHGRDYPYFRHASVRTSAVYRSCGLQQPYNIKYSIG